VATPVLGHISMSWGKSLLGHLTTSWAHCRVLGCVVTQNNLSQLTHRLIVDFVWQCCMSKHIVHFAEIEIKSNQHQWHIHEQVDCYFCFPLTKCCKQKINDAICPSLVKSKSKIKNNQPWGPHPSISHCRAVALCPEAICTGLLLLFIFPCHGVARKKPTTWKIGCQSPWQVVR